MKLFQSSARYYGGRLVMMISMEWEGQGGGGGGGRTFHLLCRWILEALHVMSWSQALYSLRKLHSVFVRHNP